MSTEKAPTRYCPTCLAQGVSTPMERHGQSFVCPRQRAEGNGISQARRESIRAAIAERDGVSPF